MFVAPDKNCDKEFRKVFFEKNQKYGLLTAGEIFNCMLMKKDKYKYTIAASVEAAIVCNDSNMLNIIQSQQTQILHHLALYHLIPQPQRIQQ